MCRTYAYGLHRKKLILVGKWPYATRDEMSPEMCNPNESTPECLNVAHVSHPVPVPALLPDHGQPVDCGVCTGGDSGLTGGDSGWTGGDSGQTGGDSGQSGGEACGVAAVSLSFLSHKT